MSMFFAIIRRDIVLAIRQGGGVGTAIGFFLAVLVLLPLALGPDLGLLASIAPGMLWIALFLSVLLTAERIFQADYEDGTLEAMLLGTIPLELVVIAKSAAHWVTTSLPLAVMAPTLGVLLNLDAALVIPLWIAMGLASVSLSLLAALGAAITVGLRRGGIIVSILILPLYVPILIFGIAASSGAMADQLRSPSLLILLALMLATFVLCPLAASAALRAHMR